MIYIVGIDPGTTTGFAVWHRQRKCLVAVASMPVHSAMQRVADMHKAGELHSVRFEDARLRTYFGGEDARQKRYGAGVREGAGAAKRESRIWRDYLAGLGVPFKAVKPTKGSTKWSADYFKRVTGWPGRTNGHARDAACLVLGAM